MMFGGASRRSGRVTDSYVTKTRETEHQLFEVSERSIFIDVLPSFILNAFLNSFSNVFSPMQALWQARWPFIAAEGFVTPQLS
jgi:hypothetical protein